MTKYQNFDLEVQTTGDVEVVIDEDEIQTVIGNYISRKIPGRSERCDWGHGKKERVKKNGY